MLLTSELIPYGTTRGNRYVGGTFTIHLLWGGFVVAALIWAVTSDAFLNRLSTVRDFFPTVNRPKRTFSLRRPESSISSPFRAWVVDSGSRYVRLMLDGPSIPWGNIECRIIGPLPNLEMRGYGEGQRAMISRETGRRTVQCVFSADSTDRTLPKGTYRASWEPVSAGEKFYNGILAETEFEFGSPK